MLQGEAKSLRPPAIPLRARTRQLADNAGQLAYIAEHNITQLRRTLFGPLGIPETTDGPNVACQSVEDDLSEVERSLNRIRTALEELRGIRERVDDPSLDVKPEAGATTDYPRSYGRIGNANAAR